jgi:hypothetical protein
MKKTNSIFVLAIILSIAATLYGQISITGSVRGKISDANNAVVTGSSVTLRNTENNNQFNAEVDENGEFIFPRVPVGNYQMTVEKQGFQTISRNFRVTVNENVVADAVLSAATVTETVTITADEALLKTQTSDVSLLVDERRVKELPLNGKNFQRLVLLAPGVAGGNVNNPSINGARPLTNTYSIDGVSANDERGAGGLSLDGGGAAGFTNASPNLVSTEAVREFNIITSNADASFGRGSGGQINLVTKSGTNGFRGSAYGYLRNDAFDARDFFNTGPFRDSQGRAVVPPFRQYLYGGNFGGRIVKDKHFFFTNYEGFRQKLEQTASATVPNAALISLIPGDLRTIYRTFYVDRGLVPTSGLPSNGTFLALPAATVTSALNAGFNPVLFDGNQANGEAGQIILSTTNTRDVKQDSFLIRTDHQFSDKLNLSFRYGYANPILTSNNRAVAGVFIENKRNWQSFAGQAVYSFEPTKLLELRFGYLRSRIQDRPRDGVESRFTALGINSEIGFTSVTLGSSLSRLEIPGAFGFVDNQDVPQFDLIYTQTNGKITFRTGLEIRRPTIEVLRISNAPFFQFSGFVGANGLIGANPSQAQALVTEASGTLYGTPRGTNSPLRTWQNVEQEYFAQADWRVSNQLTLNLGLRYAYFGVQKEKDGIASNLYAVNPANGQIVPDVSPFAFGRFNNTLAPVSDDLPFYQPDRNNFQPRIGFAYDLNGKGQTILRGGYGLYVDRQVQGLFEFGVINFPFATSGVFTNLPFTGAGTLPITPTTPTQGRFIDPTLESPYTHRYNFSIEQRIDAKTSVTVSYIGSLGRKLYRFEEPNGQGAVPQALRPDTRYSRQRFTTNASSSEYNSFQVLARRRLASGVDFTAAYTFGESKDDYSNDTGGTAQAPSLINLGASPSAGFQGGGSLFVPRPVKSDFGFSDFDVRHNFTFSHVIELPFGKGRKFLSNANGLTEALLGGFSLSGVGVWRSGDPFTISLGFDAADIGFSGYPRPALLVGTLQNLYADGRFGKTQYLIPKTGTGSEPNADQRLGVPNPITDPFAQIARNSLRSPSVRFYDVSLLKRINISERTNVQLEVNAFNVFNIANFAAPNATLNSATFGRITATRAGTNPRQLQFGVKLNF